MKVKPIKKVAEVIVGKCYRDNHGVVIWVFNKDENDFITGFLILKKRRVMIETWTQLNYLLDGSKSFYLISKEEFDLRLNEAIEEIKEQAK